MVQDKYSLNETTEDDNRKGLNGYYKTDLDLEIEKELLESNDKEETKKDKLVKRRIRIISMIPLVLAIILALIRMIRMFM
ncbi:hypothetical protein [Staphylococcus saccharolyticus]|uniref:hypothetical protein n=1 Tax=Staphylococcus saccharolyticus TaxID=33028 RepID=UPI00102D8173|nr:hypothetical protein [Staphylococcus saccharolyticus]MBL7573912.1 hypothetical protein [Staphylococcus saccharolyticus]MBL7584915.1 hypothetical protein [Staphylococcus saccharolyticus]MBL7639164.1 hypothetical protein [Staphylococcus saccharolyticus]QRJ68492.1 hypothetical protein DMB75_000520 [Staphylococcus saccharolyticus]TAA91808.1 hypothetical protein DMB74_06360 [Staphylococcus saccharolyticus]